MYASYMIVKMQISRRKEFIDRTQEALEVLRQLDPFNYRRVLTYIDQINEVQYGSAIDTKNRVFHVGTLTAFPEIAGAPQEKAIKLYAVSIVHEAVHSELDNRFCIDPYTFDERIRRKHEEIALRVQGRSSVKLGIFTESEAKVTIEELLKSEYWKWEYWERYW